MHPLFHGVAVIVTPGRRTGEGREACGLQPLDRNHQTQGIEDHFMTEILSSSSAATPARNAAGRGHKTLRVEAKSVVWNPTPAELRRFTEEMPNCRKTEFNNVNVG